MFVPHSELDLKKMFDELKINSLDDLFTHIPDALLLENGLDLPESLSELESIDYFDDIAARNKSELVCFAGGGHYDVYLPQTVKSLTMRPEFMTSYTPYQAEISQGILQVLFEFQSLVCDLTDMELANASLYDGATSIAEAINLSKNYFNDENQTNRVLCVISDGEDHEIQNNNLSDIAKEAGITIISIGVGSPNGAPIPIKENDIVKSYKKDDKGEVVITKLNENILKDMATQTGGIYFKGDNTNSVVSSIVDELKEMDKQEFESKQFVSFKDQFQWFLFVGLFLIILDVLVFERKTYWLDKLNLFNENEKV